MQKKITVLIPTHAVKTELIGPYKNSPQHNATAPSTRLIESVMSSINTNLDIEKEFVIGLDHKSDQDISNAYLNNLKLLRDKYDNVDVTYVSHTASENVLTTHSATENFFNLIDVCKTEYFLLWEHDWVFTRPIDADKIKLWENGIEFLRFNQFINKQEDHDDNKPLQCQEQLWHDEKGLRTDKFSNNPFVTSKVIWNEKYRPLAENIPDWWGINPVDGLDYGAFIEGPIERYLDHNPDKIDFYKMHMYGDYDDHSFIAHLNGQVWR